MAKFREFYKMFESMKDHNVDIEREAEENQEIDENSPILTRKHFRAIADIIKNLDIPEDNKLKVAKEFSKYLRTLHPDYSESKFMYAATGGVKEEEGTETVEEDEELEEGAILSKQTLDINRL